MIPPAASAPHEDGTPHRTAAFSVGFLGPSGTYAEEALLTQADLCRGELVPMSTIADVLWATAGGSVDFGFVPIENAIEGSVNVSIDILAFDTDLLIQREVVIAVHLNLLAQAGVELGDIKSVTSFPHAAAQCRGFLTRELPGVLNLASNSTAEAARQVADDASMSRAAIATHRASDVYGLEVVAECIEDRPENATRFVVVALDGTPIPTGHDKTSIVVFQRADAPGSLLAILQEFAARNINLTKLESRPAKTSLGDYCFLIDLEGHIDDELVADALRSLKVKQAGVKFLGSYPAAGEDGPGVRREVSAAWREADEWLESLRRGSRR